MAVPPKGYRTFCALQLLLLVALSRIDRRLGRGRLDGRLSLSLSLRLGRGLGGRILLRCRVDRGLRLDRGAPVVVAPRRGA